MSISMKWSLVSCASLGPNSEKIKGFHKGDHFINDIALFRLHNKYYPEIRSNHCIPHIQLFSAYSAMHILDTCSNKRGTQFALLALIALVFAT